MTQLQLRPARLITPAGRGLAGGLTPASGFAEGSAGPSRRGRLCSARFACAWASNARRKYAATRPAAGSSSPSTFRPSLSWRCPGTPLFLHLSALVAADGCEALRANRSFKPPGQHTLAADDERGRDSASRSGGGLRTAALPGRVERRAAGSGRDSGARASPPGRRSADRDRGARRHDPHPAGICRWRRRDAHRPPKADHRTTARHATARRRQGERSRLPRRLGRPRPHRHTGSHRPAE